MGLETPVYIDDLVATNPTADDPKSQGDDHIRNIKLAIKNTFPNVGGEVQAAAQEMNYLVGCTQNIEDRFDGLDTTKANLASPALTGTPTTPTADVGTTGNQIASLDFVIAASLSASLPGQTGNAGKFISTDGTNGFWEDTMDVSVVHPSVGTDFATTTGTQKLENKTYEDPNFCDGSDATKQLAWNLTEVGTGVQRVVQVFDEDVLLFTPGRRLLATVTASNSATVDIENAFSNTYDLYIIEAYNIVPATNAADLNMRLKKGGSYLTGNVYTQRLDNESLNTGQTSIQATRNLDNSGGHEVYLQVTLVRPFQTGRATLLTLKGGNSSGSLRSSSVGTCTTTGAVQGVRFLMSTGNITTGTFKLYGVRK